MGNEQYPEKIFDDSKEVAFINLEPLISEPYTYESMVNNPIIKPIAELDRSLRDLDDMINKKLIDSKRNKSWINAAIEDVPSYQDSPFVSKLIDLTKDTQDVIKLQDIQLKNLKAAIKEIFNIVKTNYGVLINEEKETYTEHEEISQEKDYKAYLQKLIESDDEELSGIAKSIDNLFKNDNVNKDEKRRFENSCAEIYKNEAEKSIKEIATKILRMEYQ